MCKAYYTLSCDVVTERSKVQVKVFLMKATFNSGMIAKLKHLTKLTIRMQRLYRVHNLSMKARFQALEQNIWNQEVQILSMHLIEHKRKNSLFPKLATKINIIPEAVSNRVLKLYLARQNLVHCIRFLQYILQTKNHTNVSSALPTRFRLNPYRT